MDGAIARDQSPVRKSLKRQIDLQMARKLRSKHLPGRGASAPHFGERNGSP